MSAGQQAFGTDSVDEVRPNVDTEMIISHIGTFLFELSQIFVFADELIKRRIFYESK